MKKYNKIPKSIKDLFNGEGPYLLINNKIKMNNVDAMNKFIEIVDIDKDSILLHSGSVVQFYHPDFLFHLAVYSYGLEDPSCHEYQISKVTTQDYLDELKEIENKPKKIKEIENKNINLINIDDLKEFFLFLNKF